MKPGTDFIGQPEGWRRQQIEDYEAHDYHQPSDEIRPTWEFDGMIEDAQFGFLAAWGIANAEQGPSWVAGAESRQHGERRSSRRAGGDQNDGLGTAVSRWGHRPEPHASPVPEERRASEHCDDEHEEG
jgi:hypothetical protein